MRKRAHVDAADVAGISRLAIEGTAGITDIVEEVHSAVLGNILPGALTRRNAIRPTGRPGGYSKPPASGCQTGTHRHRDGHFVLIAWYRESWNINCRTWSPISCQP